MSDYRNVAMFDRGGALLRLVSGPSAQVQANLDDHSGPWADIPLVVSDITQVPAYEDLAADGKINGAS